MLLNSCEYNGQLHYSILEFDWVLNIVTLETIYKYMSMIFKDLNLYLGSIQLLLHLNQNEILA